MFFREQDPMRSLLLIDRVSRHNLNRALKPYELNDSNFFFILILLDHPGISQDHLTKTMSLNHSTIARAVAKLVERGIIKKEIDQTDKRASRLYPTDKAQQLAEHLLPILDSVFDQTFKNLSATEKGQLLLLLNKAVPQTDY